MYNTLLVRLSLNLLGPTPRYSIPSRRLSTSNKTDSEPTDRAHTTKKQPRPRPHRRASVHGCHFQTCPSRRPWPCSRRHRLTSCTVCLRWDGDPVLYPHKQQLPQDARPGKASNNHPALLAFIFIPPHGVVNTLRKLPRHLTESLQAHAVGFLWSTALDFLFFFFSLYTSNDGMFLGAGTRADMVFTLRTAPRPHQHPPHRRGRLTAGVKALTGSPSTHGQDTLDVAQPALGAAARLVSSHPCISVTGDRRCSSPRLFLTRLLTGHFYKASELAYSSPN